jgi:hypothetical protein
LLTKDKALSRAMNSGLSSETLSGDTAAGGSVTMASGMKSMIRWRSHSDS